MDRPAARHVSARMRLNVCAAVGLVVGALVSLFTPWQLAALTGWDLTAAMLVLWVWLEVWPMDATETRGRSTIEDDSRAMAIIVLISASVVSLVGIALGLAKARQVNGLQEVLLTVVSVLTVMLSWSVVHTTFALHYAHLYYRDVPGGIDFHTEEPPDYSDFLYLAFTVGMAFAVSDTDIQDRFIRRTCLRHSLVSYLFGAVIIGLTINVMAGFVR